MNLSFLLDIGRQLMVLTDRLQEFIQLLIKLSIGIIVVLLLVRVVIDLLQLNPFSRLAAFARRPTNEIIHQMRSSSLYFPLKRTLGFDPSALMVLVALAILWYVVSGVIGQFFYLLRGLGVSLIDLGRGDVFDGARHLIGVALLAVLFFLMTLMTIVFVNWLFGMLRRASFWAMDRLTPLLRRFEFGGMLAGWSFVILWLALSFAMMAVTAIFMS